MFSEPTHTHLSLFIFEYHNTPYLRVIINMSEDGRTKFVVLVVIRFVRGGELSFFTGVWGRFVRHIPNVRETQSPNLASTTPWELRNFMLSIFFLQDVYLVTYPSCGSG